MEFSNKASATLNTSRHDDTRQHEFETDWEGAAVVCAGIMGGLTAPNSHDHGSECTRNRSHATNSNTTVLDQPNPPELSDHG